MFTEVWTTTAGIPGYTVKAARRAEDEGWDGIGLVDSQNLAGDPYIELALVAQATTRLKLATAVTNPLTRHPAAMATAIATVQAESGGRAVLGIGRGDSSLAHLGLAPAPVALFERYLERLQGYLRGQDVPFDDPAEHQGARPVSTLGLAGGPTSSRIHWLNPALPKVPVDAAATGPKVIAVAARHADRITLAVGADPARIAWAVEQAQAAGAELDDLGAYVPVLVHPDRAAARALIKGAVASFARFSVMHGRVVGPADNHTAQTLEAVHDAYDMGRHFTHGSPQSQPLTDDVVDAFGIAGPPGYCIDRLQALNDAGVKRLVVMLGSVGLDREEARTARRRMVEDVLPSLR